MRQRFGFAVVTGLFLLALLALFLRARDSARAQAVEPPRPERAREIERLTRVEGIDLRIGQRIKLFAFDRRRTRLKMIPPDSMAAESRAEIDAVALRLRYPPELTAKLQRWAAAYSDLRKAISAGPLDTDEQLETAEARLTALGQAYHKAELRALGLDGWNRYSRLRFASLQGRLEDVDDNGDYPSRGDAGGTAIVSTSPGPKQVDTSEFDRYFTD